MAIRAGSIQAPPVAPRVAFEVCRVRPCAGPRTFVGSWDFVGSSATFVNSWSFVEICSRVRENSQIRGASCNFVAKFVDSSATTAEAMRLNRAGLLTSTAGGFSFSSAIVGQWEGVAFHDTLVGGGRSDSLCHKLSQNNGFWADDGVPKMRCAKTARFANLNSRGDIPILNNEKGVEVVFSRCFFSFSEQTPTKTEQQPRGCRSELFAEKRFQFSEKHF